MSTTAEHAAAAAADTATVEALLDHQRWTGRIFSDGWVDAPATIETVEPATGQVRGTVGAADAAAVARATASAAAAQPEWAALPATERMDVVRRAAELLERHRPELERWLIRESGSIQGKAAQEITASAGQLEMAAALIAHPLGHVLPSLTPGRTSMARRVLRRRRGGSSRKCHRLRARGGGPVWLTAARRPGGRAPALRDGPHQRPDSQRGATGSIRRLRRVQQRRALRWGGEPGAMDRVAVDDRARGRRAVPVLTRPSRGRHACNCVEERI